jgi:hypothetical protein
MDSMDSIRERVEALEQHTKAMEAHTRTVERRLRWWRGMAYGFLLLGLLTWALPSGRAAYDQKDLEQRVAELEYKLEYVSGGANEVVITGANLRVVNGLGSTETTNGLGNLIVGYNEPRQFSVPNVRTGSHNVVVGQGHNFSSFGGLVVGLDNEIRGEFSTVTGGLGGFAIGRAATVSGGSNNRANGELSVVSGGAGNMANAVQSVVSGGLDNDADGRFSVVSGGRNRAAPGENNWVAGPLFANE